MKVIRFTKIRFFMIGMSVVLILAGIGGMIARGGFNLGVDFQAGLSLRVGIDNPDATIETVRSAMSAIDGVQVQTVGGEAANQYSVRVRDDGTIDKFSSVMSDRIVGDLGAVFGTDKVMELENTYVGPRFSQNLTQNTIMLTALALALILVYIWFRFKLGYAAAAIICLIHDVAFMLGFIGVFQIEVSTATIAAILTIIGYSLNDTIVIFDRIRENEHVMRESGFETIINTSITQSLSRTLVTSGTTLLAVLAILFFATGSVQTFALNLMIGIVVGTYSSIFIASPVLLGFRRATRRHRTRNVADTKGSAPNTQKLEDAKTAAPAGDAQISDAEKERVLRELSQKRATSSGRSSSRASRKKK